MGIAKEHMALRFDDIATFADIGEFIDQPVRTYSSGMFVRLAFAVAVSMEPDILVIDEALSVGDIFFQQKSINRIKHLREKGVTILFVSHSLQVMKSFCSKALYIKDGKLVGFGEVRAICDGYQNESTSVDTQDKAAALTQDHAEDALLKPQTATAAYREDAGFASRLSQRSGSREAEVVALDTLNQQGRRTASFGLMPEIRFRIHIRANRPVPAGAAVGLLISNRNGVDLTSLNSDQFGLRLGALQPGTGYTYEVIVRLSFSAGPYSVHVGLKPSPQASYFYDRCYDAAVFEIAVNPEGYEGYGYPFVVQPEQVRLFQTPSRMESST
jgi:hypothetical protein